MAFCKHCGTQMDDNAEFCPSCGKPVHEPAQGTVNNGSKPSSNDTVMAILAYFGLLVLVPILAAKDSPFARFHANQGLVICIVGLIGGLISLLSFIPAIGVIFTILSYAVSIATLVYSIMGIVYAAQGQMKALPLIDKIQILK